ncbi:MAG TPA: prepilin-type N-terminal cleavage/methylation domain-containing protein [Candidatus Acidoferrum sp.]|nr:prepilin-type N-terminal cleavage/methylation domain-containing protein [Candidatus Acidoferrum sp.]
MKERDNNLKARQGGDRTRGFSLTEMLVVIAIGMVIAGIALIQVRPALLQIQADSAKDLVQATLRRGRELAISDRRAVKVEFLVNPPANPPGSYVRLTRLGAGFGPDTVIATTPIPGSVIFTTFNGEPDTPDGFGNNAAIFFGGVNNGPAAGMIYQSDGTFAAATGVPINGTVFMGIPNQPNTARAITILGTTGRVRSYHISGTTTWFDY